MRKWTAVMLASGMLVAAVSAGAAGGDLKGTITVSGAWALYPMTVKWAEEFRKLEPGVRIDIAAGGAGKGMADALAGVADIGMVSRGITAAEEKKGAWWVAVVKDAVVPVVSEQNPGVKELLSRGATKEQLSGIWITGKVTGWSEIGGGAGGGQIHVYTRSDACGAAQTWAEYLGGKQEDLRGTGVYGDPGLAAAVKSDALGIGYNNINYAYDAKSRAPVNGIRVLPLDLNGDRRIDATEDFYGARDGVVKAINDGRYPSPPARDLYFVCHGRPEKPAVKAFVKWVLTDGQKFVGEAGYVNLSPDKLKCECAKIEGTSAALK